jgi:hypothetical protein
MRLRTSALGRIFRELIEHKRVTRRLGSPVTEALRTGLLNEGGGVKACRRFGGRLRRSKRRYGCLRLIEGFHVVGAWCLVALVSLHGAAALFHHFVRRDDVLEAMAPVLRRRPM